MELILFVIFTEAGISLYHACKLKSKRERKIKIGLTIIGTILLTIILTKIGG